MRYDVLIVGGGFGGATVGQRLERLLPEGTRQVLMVAEENFFLLSPLLPEAAAGTIEPRHTVIPLREMLRTTSLVVGRVTSIDIDARTAVVHDTVGNEHRVEFTALVLAPRSVPAVFPVPGLAESAVGFKTLPDAMWLRNRVLVPNYLHTPGRPVPAPDGIR